MRKMLMGDSYTQNLIERAVSIDWTFVFGQSNGTPNSGSRAEYASSTLNQTISLGQYPLGFTLNPGYIPGIRDLIPPQAIGDTTPTVNQNLFPIKPIVEGQDWFDGLSGDEVEQHGESMATAYFKTLNNLNGSSRLYGITSLNRDGDDINSNLSGNGTIAGCFSWFIRCLQFLYQVFGSKLRVPYCFYFGGEADNLDGTVTTTASAGTALTLPLSGATLNVTSTTSFPASNSVIMLDSNMGSIIASYTSASGGVFSGVTTSMPSSFNGATVVTGAVVTHAPFAGNGVLSGTPKPGLFSLQSAIQTEVQSVLGGSPFVPLFIDQQFGEVASTTRQPTAQLAYLAWLQGSANGVTNPLQLMGPRYHRPTSTISTGLHVHGGGIQGMGELAARCAYKVFYQGQPWTPLYPTSVSYSGGTTAVATFSIPVGNLVGDAQMCRISKSGSGNVAGWKYRDSGGTITLANVAVTASNQLTFTFSSSPSANTNRILAYAIVPDFTGINQAQSAILGLRGNFRDQDTYVSLFGQPSYNWLVCCDIGF